MAQEEASDERENWEEAGVTNEDQATLDRPVDMGRYYIPNPIELDRDRQRILWRLTLPVRLPPYREVTVGRDMLDAFVELYKTSPDRIWDYARKWGMLLICEHGLPCTHNPYPSLSILSQSTATPVTWCKPREDPDGAWWESIEVWQSYSRLMRSLINVASYLHFDKPARAEDWETVFIERRDLLLIFNWSGLEFIDWKFGDEFPPMWRQTKEIQRIILERIINTLLSWQRVRPVFHWTKGIPSMSLDSEGLFGTLVTQLMFNVSRTDGWAVCTACGRSYVPNRRPPKGKRNYCPEKECQKAKSRATSRDDYQRRKKVRIE